MRNYDDFISAYQEYCESGECPYHMLQWVAVSAIGGALQRKVWFNQGKFRWFPNLYIILVAPPGVISKTITTGSAMELLRGVDGVHFGPSTVTWQALVSKFTNEKITQNVIVPRYVDGKAVGGETLTFSALTIFSGELGTLVAPNDREMLDCLTNLWDCISFSKETMKDGEIFIENPYLNLVACTTPEWVTYNLPEYMIGSGLLSRCVMLYADTKRQLAAYPGLSDRAEQESAMKPLLIQDLKHISTLTGEFQLTQEAYDWGVNWYEEIWTTPLKDSREQGLRARKQTMAHKIAMILSASRGDSKKITLRDLKRAVAMLDEASKFMPQIFDYMGKTKDASHADRIVSYVQANPGCSNRQVYAHVHNYFPKVADFDAVMAGLMKSGLLSTGAFGNKIGLVVTGLPA